MGTSLRLLFYNNHFKNYKHYNTLMFNQSKENLQTSVSCSLEIAEFKLHKEGLLRILEGI